jgi:transposase
MIRIQLDDATRTELQSLRRTATTAKLRDRLEMVFLSAAGWSPPRIATHLACDPQTVRKILHRFQQDGTQAFVTRRPGPAADTARRDRILGLLRELLGQDRTWTSAQLADALRTQQVCLSGRQVRRYLRLLHAGYRRTASTLRHKQDPVKVERAKVVLGNLKKKPRPVAYS